MTRRKCFLLYLLLILILVGCHHDTVPATEPTTEPTIVATEPVTEATEPVWTGYVSPAQDYIYLHSEGRDREWEEDVIYFANSHLTDNQLLRNRLFIVNLPGVRTDSANFYNPEIHAALLEAVNALIPEIPNLTDDEILYRIQMMSALFQDVHTRAYGDDERIYPILFFTAYEEGKFIYYAVLLPERNEDLLYTRLTAINGIPIEEVVERMRGYVSYENEYGFQRSLGYGGYSHEFLSLPSALEAVGISEIGDNYATYTLADQDGNTRDLMLKVITTFRNGRYVGTTANVALPIAYWNENNENYWYTTNLAESTLYVRILGFEVEEGETYAAFSNKLTLERNSLGHIDRIILDLRGNGGGYRAEGWRSIIETLARMDCGQFYILVDGGTYSNSMIFASEIAYLIPDVIFVGSPTGEAPGFFAGIYDSDYILPNCGIEFTVPTQYYQTFEAHEENTLIPDILIWPTIEDYQNSRDVVLEYILTQ